MFDAANCSVPTNVATDPGVAGAGVLLSFIITATIALLLSIIIILREFQKNYRSVILRKFLLSLSDQQIITGIGIQSIGLAKLTSMVQYHFFIVWMLSLLSMATHLGTLLALVNDFKRDWVLRWIRQLLMFVNLVLSCVFGIYMLIAKMHDMEPKIPIACAFHNPQSQIGSAGNKTLSVIGTIAVMVGSCLVFVAGVWYLHSRQRKWFKPVQAVGMLILIALAVGAGVRVIQVSQAFGVPDAGLNLRDEGEKDWSYGQLLPMLLLLLPLISVLEIVRGQVNIPSETADDRVTLLGSNDNRQSFQPNPFWGSQTYKLRNVSK